MVRTPGGEIAPNVSRSWLLALAVAAFLVRTSTGCAAPLALREEGQRALLLKHAQELEPRVVALLGTEWTSPFEVRVHELEGCRAETRRGDRRVTVDPDSFDDGLRMTVAHELVHVHATGRWAGLPRGVEEGLAYWVAARVTGLAEEYEGPEPCPEALRAALTLDDQGYDELHELERADVHQAAAWLASRLIP